MKQQQDTQQDDVQRQHRRLAAEIARTLNETEPGPKTQLRKIVEALGEAAARDLLAEVQRIEAEGGIMLPDESRRRTPGGVFFHLAYHRLPAEQRRNIYRQRKPGSSKGGGGGGSGGGQAPSQPADRWQDRQQFMAEVGEDKGDATTMKVKLIGKLGKIVERQGFTLAMMKHTPRLNSLPKGIPTPNKPQETTYVVYIGGKQWRKVKDALRDPEDVAIIEGTQMWDDEYQAMAVFATSVTTKLTQQTMRETQKAQAEEPNSPAE